jgi:hypothetical protein
MNAASLRGGDLAEGVGFEPTEPFGSPVFETGALDRAMRPLRIERRRGIIPGPPSAWLRLPKVGLARHSPPPPT